MNEVGSFVNYLVYLCEDGAKDINNIRLVSEMRQTQHPFQLLKTHYRRCSTHETNYRCMGKKIHNET